MLTPRQLDACLEVWAQFRLGDRSLIRRLGYPSSTPEWRYALRDSVTVRTTPLEPGYEFEEMALATDRALAQLRAKHPRWFKVILISCTVPGTDDLHARILRVSYNAYKSKLYRARKWLSSHISILECKNMLDSSDTLLYSDS